MKKQITKVGHIITIKNSSKKLEYKFIEGSIARAEKIVEYLKGLEGMDQYTYFLSNKITLNLNKK